MVIKTIKISALKVIRGLLNIWTDESAASRDFTSSSFDTERVRRMRVVLAAIT